MSLALLLVLGLSFQSPSFTTLFLDIFLPLLEADSGLGRSPSLPVLWVVPGGWGILATDWRWPQGTGGQGELQMMGGAGTGPPGWKAFSKYSLNIY